MGERMSTLGHQRVSTSAQSGAPEAPSPTLASDMLKGAEAIAEFLLGDAGERRIIYHLASTTDLPVFRLGSILCARRSVLIGWISSQEAKAKEGPVSRL